MTATADNTAVVTIMAYADDSLVPTSCNFMLASAKRLGIKVHVFRRGETYTWTPNGFNADFDHNESFDEKILKLEPHLEALPYKYDYILYLDARDVLFLRSLEDICAEFNAFGWPIVSSSESVCQPHVDPGWKSRFGITSTGFNYNNSGIWMGERDAVMSAFQKMKELSVLVRDDKIKSSSTLSCNADQHLWQTAYVEHSFPLRLDYEQRLFLSAHITPFDDYDFSLSTPETPIVLRNGSRPGLAHFAGQRAIAMPYVAWLLNIVAAGITPPLEYP